MTARAHGGIVIGLLLAGGVAALAQAAAGSAAGGRENPVHHARGTFEVKVTPLEQDTPLEGAVLGRMSLDKQFLGDLVASSHGEMLTASNGVEGSGAYVALERVSGTLAGRRGTFVLQHAGTRTPGQPQQIAILVVPDSGTGELTGLLGRLTIHMDEGKHTYDLEYTLPGAP
jgi:hypothetical protein